MEGLHLQHVCLVSIGVIFLLFAPLIVSAFTSDADVAPHAVHCLRIVSAGFLFYGYGMALTAAFNGAGDTRTPTLINLFEPVASSFRSPGDWRTRSASVRRRVHRLSVGFSTSVYLLATCGYPPGAAEDPTRWAATTISRRRRHHLLAVVGPWARAPE